MVSLEFSHAEDCATAICTSHNPPYYSMPEDMCNNILIGAKALTFSEC